MPGASAQREYETRAASERAARRRSWPRRLPGAVAVLLLCLPAAVLFQPLALVMGVVVAVTVVVAPMWAAASSGTLHYRTGASGEREVGRRLHEVVDRRLSLGQGAAVLHDRKLPGRDENVDHVLVTPAGVTVVETKNWSGQLRQYRGSWYAGRRSSVGEAATQARRQALAVTAVLRSAGITDVPVSAVVCLVGQARPRTALQVKDVVVCGVDQLWVALPLDQGLDQAQVAAAAWALDGRLKST